MQATDTLVAAPQAPAVVAAQSLGSSIRVEQLTYAIGAELSNVDLGVASRDSALVAEIRQLLLKYRVLFFRNQDFTRAEHVAFARHFGELEDHPVAGSDPENPGLVRIYKTPDKPNDRYENSWHTDATWREAPPFGCVLRCVECPPVGGDTMWANMVLAYETPARARQDPDRRPARAPQHRGHLRRRDADREAPRAARAVSRRRAPGRAHAPRDRREGAVRERLHDALHQFPHARARARRPGLHARRRDAAAATCSRRPSSPSTRCAGAGSPTASPCGTTAARSTTRSWTTRRAIARWSAPGSSATSRSDHSTNTQPIRPTFDFTPYTGKNL